ncbi:Uncharacterised protein [uncultured archaeon]|nr:Uncharacterised protein [uncultured archaeon]
MFAVAVFDTLVLLKLKSTVSLAGDRPVALKRNVMFTADPAVRPDGHAVMLVAHVTLSEQEMFSTWLPVLVSV